MYSRRHLLFLAIRYDISRIDSGKSGDRNCRIDVRNGEGLAIHSTIRELFAAGPVSAKVVVVLALMLALAAFSISGSWFQALQVLFEARADGDEWWRLLVMGFVGDITGTPGLLVSGLKTVFAVLVAFAVVRLLPVGRGRLSFSFKGIKLSGAQSAALLWCVAFAVVKLV